MKKLLERLLKMKGVKKVKKLSNNKGFSLIELLIVIAIMGVLAVIAFNMFGGVLTNSKKRADDQQALNLQKAILTYCVDSGDWGLTEGTVAGGTSAGLGSTTEDLVKALLQEITDEDGKSYGPMLSLKDPDSNATADVNVEAYTKPQWNTDDYGADAYTGFHVEIWKEDQVVKVTPTKETTPAVDAHD